LQADEDVSVVRHDSEAVTEEFPRLAVAEESGNEEFGVFGALEVSVAIEVRIVIA
jgi:hypothetical protein